MSYKRDEPPWRSWTIEQWTLYRDRQAAAVERFAEPWASNVGRACVRMAEHHIERLQAEADDAAWAEAALRRLVTDEAWA